MPQIERARAAIRAQQEKLARMDSFLSSLEASDIDFLRSALGEQTTTSVDSPEMSNEPVQPSAEKKQAGTLESAMLSVVRNMEIVTAPKIVRTLGDEGFVFGSANALAAANQVIRKWKGNGFLVEIEAGSGRRASIYKKSDQRQEEMPLAS